MLQGEGSLSLAVHVRHLRIPQPRSLVSPRDTPNCPKLQYTEIYFLPAHLALALQDGWEDFLFTLRPIISPNRQHPSESYRAQLYGFQTNLASFIPHWTPALSVPHFSHRFRLSQPSDSFTIRACLANLAARIPHSLVPAQHQGYGALAFLFPALESVPGQPCC